MPANANSCSTVRFGSTRVVSDVPKKAAGPTEKPTASGSTVSVVSDVQFRKASPWMARVEAGRLICVRVPALWNAL
jgi:hypothetical protein